METPARAMTKNMVISPMGRRTIDFMVRANATMMTMMKKMAVLDRWTNINKKTTKMRGITITKTAMRVTMNTKTVTIHRRTKTSLINQLKKNSHSLPIKNSASRVAT